MNSNNSNQVIIVSSEPDLSSIATDVIDTTQAALNWGMDAALAFTAFGLFAAVIAFAIRMSSR
ncbi:MAG: hypothetical protein HRT68_14480 [Flavobacteriaceae bacterium]|nr:hypothetical protein [Flavobacteriaceae bacterium]